MLDYGANVARIDYSARNGGSAIALAVNSGDLELTDQILNNNPKDSHQQEDTPNNTRRQRGYASPHRRRPRHHQDSGGIARNAEGRLPEETAYQTDAGIWLKGQRLQLLYP